MKTIDDALGQLTDYMKVLSKYLSILNVQKYLKLRAGKGGKHPIEA